MALCWVALTIYQLSIIVTPQTNSPSKMSESEVKALAQDAKENGVEGVKTDAPALAAAPAPAAVAGEKKGEEKEEVQVGEKRKADE